MDDDGDVVAADFCEIYEGNIVENRFLVSICKRKMGWKGKLEVEIGQDPLN